MDGFLVVGVGLVKQSVGGSCDDGGEASGPRGGSMMNDE